MNAASFPDREAVAEKFQSFQEADQSFFMLLMQNAAQDDNLIDGLLLWLNRSAEARFLNTLKLGNVGHWLGESAPVRLQMRLTEVGRSSQHAAYIAFRDGLERAFPKANV